MRPAVMSGAGVTVLTDLVKGQDVRQIQVKSLTSDKSENSDESGINLVNGQDPSKNNTENNINIMRPVRKMQNISVTVGQNEGFFQGKDDKIIQAAIDYVGNLGGGTVNILPGIYNINNSLFPHAGIILRGSRDKTILLKSKSISTKIIRDADWYEYCVFVEDSRGILVGAGLALSTDNKNPEEVHLFTVTAINGNAIYLNRRTELNYWMADGARASTRFSILHGLNVNDVQVFDLVLDGNKSENEHIDDNYAGAVFMQACNHWVLKNVTARNFNGDGFSFQVCDDIQCIDCSSLKNSDLGYHSGSGSTRPVFKHCTAKENREGFYFCWGSCFALVEDCISTGNNKYGFTFGHRDTDNLIRNCTIEHNGETGILLREEAIEYLTADRNVFDNCTVRDNGNSVSGLGIDIQWKTKDIAVRNCRFENASDGPQKTGIRISSEALRIALKNNIFSGCKIEVEDQRK